MAQNKHKTKRRIICILCASIIALYALLIPIGAVVNSSQVGLGQTGLYGESTFPFTVGFVQRDEALDRNYIFATEIGGFGQNGNQTVEGDDIFYWNYPDASDEETSSINYTFGDTVWPNSLSYRDMNSSTGAVGSYKGGYTVLDLQYNHLATDFNPTTESIIFKANNIYYNPIWLAEIDGDSYSFKNSSRGEDTMIPVVMLPVLDDYNTQKFVGAYSVEATVIDMNGERHWIQYSVPIDTTGETTGSTAVVGGIPFISPSSLKQFINPEDIELWISGEVDGSNSTICIEEYRGYLDVDYYEYIESEPQDELAGIWILNETLNPPSSDYDFVVNGSFYRCKDSSGTLGTSALTRIWLRTPTTVSPHIYLRNASTFENTSMYYSASDGRTIRSYYSSSGIYFAHPSSSLGNSLRTLTITSSTNDVSVAGDFNDDNGIPYGKHLYDWLSVNAVKAQGGANSLAEEGTWEKVTDTELLNKCIVTYPRYDTSAVTDPSLSAQTWLAYPTAEKMLSGVISMHEPDEVIIPEIDEDMYKDYTGWLGTAVKGFFDTPILGGMSLGVIVGVIVMFSCAIALLKIFAGG